MTLDDELELERLRGEPQLSVGTGDIDAAEMQAIEESGRTKDEVMAEHDARPENMDNLLPRPEAKVPYKFSPAAMMFNAPGSAWQLAKDVTYPVRHPVQTYQTMSALSEGVLSQLGIKDGDETTVEAVKQALMDRYGSFENAQKSLESDPFGVLTDITGIISGGAGLAAKLPGKIGAIAGTAADVAKRVDPINFAATTVAKVPAKYNASKVDPIDQILQATKFSPGMDVKYGIGTRRRLAKTMLENGYSLDDAGLAKLVEDMTEVGLKMEDILNSDAANTNIVPPSRVMSRIPAFLQKHTNPRTKLHPDENRDAIQGEVQPWKTANERNTALTAREVNEIKKDAYKRAGYDKGDNAKLALGAETNRQIGRGAKELVSEMLPEIKPYNEKWGKLAELKDPLTRAAAVSGQRDPSGIMPLLKAGVVGVTASSVDPILGGIAAYTAYKRGLGKNPKAKVDAAHETYRLQSKSYGDLYADHGSLPTLMRGLFAELGQEEQMLLEDPNANTFSDFAKNDLTVKSLWDAWDTKR